MQHVDEWRSSDCLMAIRLCIFTAHESQRTEKPTATYSDPPPSSALFCPFSVIQLLIRLRFSFRCLSLTASPVLYHFSFIVCLSLCLDLAQCIPSCLIKACIINTAIPLSSLLPSSHDGYIKCKLFHCNSLLMSLL